MSLCQPQMPVMLHTIPSELCRSMFAPKRKQRQKFTPDEDRILREHAEKFGPDSWQGVLPQLTNRTVRQCRERWKNYLSPSVSHSEWTPEEDKLLEELVAEHGPLWSKLAPFFENRTDVIIKNRYSLLKRHVRLGLRPPLMTHACSADSLRQEPTTAIAEESLIHPSSIGQDRIMDSLFNVEESQDFYLDFYDANTNGSSGFEESLFFL